MSWELLPEDYTDREWDGLQKFRMLTNPDETVSFQDVTEYVNQQNSFFGSAEANKMNHALNVLMSMVEQGTDLYEAFQQYFATQSELFEHEAQETIDNTEAIMQEDFLAWYEHMKDQLDEDAAGHLQLEIDELTENIEQEIETIENNYEKKHNWINYIIRLNNWDTDTKIYSFENDYPSSTYDINNILPASTATEEQREQWAQIDCGGYYSTNFIVANGDLPTIDIPVMIDVKSHS